MDKWQATLYWSACTMSGSHFLHHLLPETRLTGLGTCFMSSNEFVYWTDIKINNNKYIYMYILMSSWKPALHTESFYIFSRYYSVSVRNVWWHARTRTHARARNVRAWVTRSINLVYGLMNSSLVDKKTNFAFTLNTAI